MLIVFAAFYAVVCVVKNVTVELDKKTSDDLMKNARGASRHELSDDDFEAARRMVEEMKRRANPLKSGLDKIDAEYAAADSDIGSEVVGRKSGIPVNQIFNVDESGESPSGENADVFKSAVRGKDTDIYRKTEKLNGRETVSVQQQNLSAYGCPENADCYEIADRVGKTCAIFDDADSLKRAVIVSELLSPPLSLRKPTW